MGAELKVDTISERTSSNGVVIDLVTLKDGVVNASGINLGSAALVESELEMLDGITAGTVIASKALVEDANTGYNDIDFLSNGIKIHDTGDSHNGDGFNYVYWAWAESPFVSSSGVPATAR